ncbi:hypothetical protein B0H03_102106 [Rathayibacter iranicus NCPPB 2253 = VKM Ac-1602]|uniref:Uncharacterized protein n=1 Tax=Rathayibacter iranicus NCPPB 2253 = VKM Ac-1602 TaxID=1328868 RepID=A0ABX5LI94_9MICO|nr:hypothetical protein B0H03_102106 [Rathayibacter iranicus NCPPB 2253 = VKM Ac-1602]
MHAPAVAVPAGTDKSDRCSRSDGLADHHRGVDRLDGRDQPVGVRDADDRAIDHVADERHRSRGDRVDLLTRSRSEVDAAVPGGVVVRWRAPRRDDLEAGNRRGPQGREQRDQEDNTRIQERGAEHVPTLAS